MDGLQYTFQHSSWATRRLIDACRSLTPEQIEATTPGAMGSVLQTLNHVVNSEWFRFRTLLAGTAPGEWRRREVADLDTLAARAEQTESFWADHLAAPVDAEHPVRVEFQGQA